MDSVDISMEQLKAEATASQAAASAIGKNLKRGHALEAVAQKHGFKNWRSARAACSMIQAQQQLNPESSAAVLSVKSVLTPAKDDLESWTVRRSDDAPLRFRGVVIGQGVHEQSTNDEYDRTTVYRSVSGKYIAEHVIDATCLESPHRSAAAFRDAGEMVAWLRDEHGKLGRTEIVALARAAANDEKVDQAFGEDIE